MTTYPHIKADASSVSDSNVGGRNNTNARRTTSASIRWYTSMDLKTSHHTLERAQLATQDMHHTVGPQTMCGTVGGALENTSRTHMIHSTALWSVISGFATSQNLSLNDRMSRPHQGACSTRVVWLAFDLSTELFSKPDMNTGWWLARTNLDTLNVRTSQS